LPVLPAPLSLLSPSPLPWPSIVHLLRVLQKINFTFFLGVDKIIFLEIATTMWISSGRQWHNWLRHCSTSQKVTDLIPSGVIGIFHWHNPSGCPMDPGVNWASNRNEYQENFLWGKGSQCVGLTLLPSCANCLEIWRLQTPETLRACTGIALPFTYQYLFIKPFPFLPQYCTKPVLLIFINVI
jgi:hypothetical protein